MREHDMNVSGNEFGGKDGKRQFLAGKATKAERRRQLPVLIDDIHLLSRISSI